MTLSQPISRCTPEEYLRHERDATLRHEYYRGEIFAMSGGSPQHSLVIANVNREMGNALKGKPCRVFDSNLRVRIPRKTLYTYPDVSIICGKLEFDPIDLRQETVLNPAVIVEVLSPSTESWDRGGKFANYQQIDSLKHYLLVSASAAHVEIFSRQADGWLYVSETNPGAAIRLTALGIEIPMSEIYAGVEFPPLPDETASAV